MIAEERAEATTTRSSHSFLWASLFSLLFLPFPFSFFIAWSSLLCGQLVFHFLHSLHFFYDALTKRPSSRFPEQALHLFLEPSPSSALHRVLLSAYFPNPMGHRTRRPIVFLALALALFGQALAVPIARLTSETLYRRQAQGSPLTQTVVTQTVQTTQTSVLFSCLTGAL